MRKICDVAHEGNIVALCKKEQMLICNECLKAGHLDHQRVFISTLAKNILSYSQEVLNSADDAVQNFECVLASMNKDDTVAVLRAKITKAFEAAQKRLMECRDKLLEDLQNCGLVREIARCSEDLGEQEKLLRETQKQVEGVRGEIQRLIDQKNYVGVINVQSQLAEYEAKIAELSEGVNACTTRLKASVGKISSLSTESVLSDLPIEKLVNPQFLERLQPSHSPEEQKSPLDFSVTAESGRYTLRQSLESLLVGIENTHGKDVVIYSVATSTFHNLRFSKEFKVPLNFALIEKPRDAFVYITGGWLGGKYKRETYEYALLLGKVTRRAPMKTARRSHAGTYCRGAVVCGGENSDGHLNSCEVFDVGKNIWTSLPNLSERKSYCTACTMDEARVYLFGGYTNVNGAQKKFDTVEMLDLGAGNKEWTVVKLARRAGWTARQDVGALQVSEKGILLFGGAQKGTTLLFNVESREMESAGSMGETDQFYQRTAKLIGEKVFVMGSGPGKVWCYDLKAQKWGTIAAA